MEWRGIPIKYYENKRYLETNNIVSLYKAIDFCDEDMLMLECDIFYHKEMLEALKAGRKAYQRDELLKAMKNSSRSYEEILAFITSGETSEDEQNKTE